MTAFSLLQDMAIPFSIEFREPDQHRGFYRITPQGDKLEELLCYQNNWFIEHDLDKLLSLLISQMMKNKKTWIELVTWKNEDGLIIGISLKTFKPLWSCSGHHYTYFISIAAETKKPCFFRIPKKRVICCSLQGIEIPNGYFIRLLSKLRKYDLPKSTDMMLNSKKTHFDFSTYRKAHDLGILKDTKDIGWIGRDYNNPNLSESYLLFRTGQYKEFRRKLLQYLIHQINRLLCQCADEIGYCGHIEIRCSFAPLSNILDRLASGEICITQASEYIWKKKPVI